MFTKPNSVIRRYITNSYMFKAIIRLLYLDDMLHFSFTIFELWSKLLRYHHFLDGKFQVMAVKKINFSVFPSHPSDLFIELVANISMLNHPNLAELAGYCSEHGQCLLAYEFYRNGSLHDFLHLKDEHSKPLSWNNRVKIALGSARALE